MKFTVTYLGLNSASEVLELDDLDLWHRDPNGIANYACCSAETRYTLFQ